MKIPLGMFFDTRIPEMTFKMPLKFTGIELWANPIKIYHAVYICKKKDVAPKLSKRSFNHTLSNITNLIW